MIRVLMIDEELPEDIEKDVTPTPYMCYYAEALQEDPEIVATLCRTFEEARGLLKKKDFDVVSIDVCMPLLDGNENLQSKHGSRTGLILYRDVVGLEEWNPAIILLSNIPPQVLEKDLKADYPFHDRLAILLKLDTAPFQFVEKIKELFEEEQQ